MCSNVMAGLSGLNMVYEAAGMHASLLGFCHESLILGDDLIGQARRCVRGIEVNEDTLSYHDHNEPHQSVGANFLGQDGNDLVKFGVDMSELSEYLDNIIQVVNQHAKLLDQVSSELAERPKATIVGELFSTLSLAYPYEKQLQ